MSGSGRRRDSKWDMKEDTSPENRRDHAHSNNAGNLFHERESREYMPGRRGFERDDRMNEESIVEWHGGGGGQYKRRISPVPDGRRQQSRSRSPRRSRDTSYRSRSKSRSRSRSPAHNNLQWEPSVHRSSSKSGHSAPVCRDFAAGRCKKSDICRFAHHTSPNHDSRSQFGSRTMDGWDSRRGNDGASRNHSDALRSNTNICNEFLKGRCSRGASCKYRHHDSGSDKFGRRETERNYRDGDNDWRNKRGSSYDNEARISSDPVCKFFAAGNCRNGKHCKFSHQREGQYNHERRSPDGRRREHNLVETTNKGWNDDANWGDRTSLRRVPGESVWEAERSDFRDSRKSKSGDWSKDDFSNHQLADPNYMRGAANHGSESMASNGNQSLQWERNVVSVSEFNSIEKGFTEGKMSSPKGTSNSQIGHVDQRSDTLPFSQTSLPFGEQDTAQRGSTENHYLSGIIQANISGDISQPKPSFPMDITPGVRNNGSMHVNANISTIIPCEQSVLQIEGGYGDQSKPTFPIHQLGVENVQMAHHHQPVLDSNLGMVQCQTTFSSVNQIEGLQIPHRQPVVDPNPADNSGVSQAAAGIPLSQTQNSLNEQLVQYSNLSATLVQLLEKRQQLPQLYAAISQQTASVQPIQASEPTRQYDPITDSVETKLGLSEIPSSNFNLNGGMTIADPNAVSSRDELQLKDDQLNEQVLAVLSAKEENGQEPDNGANETQEALDQGVTDDAALDSGAEDGKKAKDAKGIRPFKFALAEFVKELLKSVWKEGKMSKEVYKNIVKKVVDKVTDAIQVAHIPRTKEKIDQYLSLSKPKLNKLTQAYLEKYHKT